MYDEIEYDSLPGSIGDETDVQVNKTRKTISVVQSYYGESHAESVELDEEQARGLIAKCVELFGLHILDNVI
ncbi:MAG: hypothetical protein ACXWP0_01265 [Ktedonobacterales bacterium]